MPDKMRQEVYNIIDDLPETADEHPGDIANMIIERSGLTGQLSRRAVKNTRKVLAEKHDVENLADNENLPHTAVEPIKVSTLAQFEWCPIDAFIEHLKEIGDPRVSTSAKSSDALEAGKTHHDTSSGLIVTNYPETPESVILSRMKDEKGTAINFGHYRILGTPDDILIEDDSVRVVDVKTTGWDGQESYKEHLLPPCALQVQIYSWMLSHSDDVNVENPIVDVQKRDNDTLSEWFTEEIEYDYDATEEKIKKILTLFDSPTKLPPLRPNEDWKCRDDDHWERFVNGVVFSDEDQ
jgi:hypothetical protein